MYFILLLFILYYYYCIVNQIVSNNNYNFVLSNDNKVYSWGYNEDGELGLDNTTHTYYPKEIKELRGKNIEKVFIII